MNDHDHVVLGALLHDIGKFWERAELLDDYRRSEEQKQQDCPWHSENGYWSHLHVLNTRRFCDLLREKLPFVAPEPGTDRNWVSLAVRHHVASGPLEQLVAAADRFASAEREKGNFYERAIHKKTRLEALLGRVTLSDGERSNDSRLPMAELDLRLEAIYPRQAERFNPPMRKSGEGWIADGGVQEEYQRIGEAFLKALDRLPQFNARTPEALRSAVRTLLALMERFLSNVPAATNIVHPDISLFDHLRVTAAIAEGLYLHHAHQGTLDRPDSFRTDDVPKWRLVCGDFSGIQNFIYKITAKGAAKALRGRSFYIQLLCDGISEHLLRKLGLYPTVRIYSSGGKFFLLIPAHLETALRREAGAVNGALLREFQGEVFLGIGSAEVRGSDFEGGRMGTKWKEAAESLQEDRLRAFRKQAEASADFFDAHELHGEHCAVCGRDDAEADIRTADERRICEQCYRLEQVGGRLKDANYLFWVWSDDRERARRTLIRQSESGISLPGADFDVYLLAEPPVFSELTRLENAHLESINCFADPDGNRHGYSCGFRLAGKWDKGKTSGEWEFDTFAEEAEGIHKFGVLRMDVDNLGEIFIRGLDFKDQDTNTLGEREKPLGSLSRVATLSRQLHLFFAGYLMELLGRFPRTQVIYAGGDDVFLIGSWDELPFVAKAIREEFRRYCADNEHFTLSGGIAVVDGRYPIARAAELAGDAEHDAKTLKRGKLGRKEKDALSFLDTAIGWENFESAETMQKEIIGLIAKMDGNRAVIGRLRAVVEAADEFRRLSLRRNYSSEQVAALVHWQRWRWRLVYNIERMAKRHSSLAPQLKKLVEQIVDPEAKATQPVLDWLQLPTRWAEFLTRRKN
jgi:CRISPR-associated protein Csm1